MMKPLVFPLVCLMVFLLSCEKPKFDSTCNVMDPSEELGWLKDRIAGHTDNIGLGSSYHSFVFKNETYIVQGYCGKSYILIVSTYFDCKGKEKSFSSEELEMIQTLETNLIWRGSDCG